MFVYPLLAIQMLMATSIILCTHSHRPQATGHMHTVEHDDRAPVTWLPSCSMTGSRIERATGIQGFQREASNAEPLCMTEPKVCNSPQEFAT
eukprot:3555479-Pleurochrysis_carterae.AAC.1